MKIQTVTTKNVTDVAFNLYSAGHRSADLAIDGKTGQYTLMAGSDLLAKSKTKRELVSTLTALDAVWEEETAAETLPSDDQTAGGDAAEAEANATAESTETATEAEPVETKTAQRKRERKTSRKAAKARVAEVTETPAAETESESTDDEASEATESTLDAKLKARKAAKAKAKAKKSERKASPLEVTVKAMCAEGGTNPEALAKLFEESGLNGRSTPETAKSFIARYASQLAIAARCIPALAVEHNTETGAASVYVLPGKESVTEPLTKEEREKWSQLRTVIMHICSKSGASPARLVKAAEKAGSTLTEDQAKKRIGTYSLMLKQAASVLDGIVFTADKKAGTARCWMGA